MRRCSPLLLRCAKNASFCRPGPSEQQRSNPHPRASGAGSEAFVVAAPSVLISIIAMYSMTFLSV
jgi:hypothetical protein